MIHTLVHRYHEKQVTKNCAVQVGKSAFPPLPPPVTRKSVTPNTPKKLKRTHTAREDLPPPPVVTNLPGKSGKETSVKATRKVTGKCFHCQIIWESKQDEKFRKTNGMRKTTWVGCDIKSCSFWAHASCANMILTQRKPIEEHSFLCPKHKK